MIPCLAQLQLAPQPLPFKCKVRTQHAVLGHCAQAATEHVSDLCWFVLLVVFLGAAGNENHWLKVFNATTCSVPCGGGTTPVLETLCYKSDCCQPYQAGSLTPGTSLLADSACDSNARPTDTTVPCNTGACPAGYYSWSTGAWGTCSCSTGVQSRSVSCIVTNTGAAQPDSACSNNVSPSPHHADLLSWASRWMQHGRKQRH